MNNSPTTTPLALPRWLRPWEQFWFTPADPTIWGLIRITAGLIVAYTFLAYSFHLQDFMGEHAWHDLELRLDVARNKPVPIGSLTGFEYEKAPIPKNNFELEYYNDYRRTWGVPPPAPYPADLDDAKYLNEFRLNFGVDLRMRGLRIPKDDVERDYAESYTRRWKSPPPAYPKDEAERIAVEDYLVRQGYDPRTLYAKGTPVFSVWFDVLDPQAMAIIHGLVLLVMVLFTVGFCTRLTSALTWFASMCYIHRNPTMLFGVDTMMTILLLYLMISPCGAALSVDRLLLRWWSKAKPGIVQGWYRFWKMPVPAANEIAPVAFAETPEPSVSANFALRLLQIHLCAIYLTTGLSKLQGPAWWNGTAIWGTIANAEFAPMQFEIYVKFLNFLGENIFYKELFLTVGGWFTLIFEIGYAFLIWRPRLRWVFLAMAITLHGGIGLFMGLKTFSMMMLVMNMAFLKKEEVYWLIAWFGVHPAKAAMSAVPRPAEMQREPAGAAVK